VDIRQHLAVAGHCKGSFWTLCCICKVHAKFVWQAYCCRGALNTPIPPYATLQAEHTRTTSFQHALLSTFCPFATVFDQVVDRLARSGGVDLIVVDSVAALVPRAEVEADVGTPTIGAQARLMSSSLRKLVSSADKMGCTVLFLNQLRHKVGRGAAGGGVGVCALIWVRAMLVCTAMRLWAHHLRLQHCRLTVNPRCHSCVHHGEVSRCASWLAQATEAPRHVTSPPFFDLFGGRVHCEHSCRQTLPHQRGPMLAPMSHGCTMLLPLCCVPPRLPCRWVSCLAALR
jgi:hypothetical protein